jgi:hypothetical protein
MLFATILPAVAKCCSKMDDMFLVQLVHHSEGFDFLLQVLGYYLCVIGSLNLFHCKVLMGLEQPLQSISNVLRNNLTFRQKLTGFKWSL